MASYPITVCTHQRTHTPAAVEQRRVHFSDAGATSRGVLFDGQTRVWRGEGVLGLFGMFDVLISLGLRESVRVPVLVM
jgi:hypothetical protein